MARIAGVNLPRNKRIVIALTYIYGIGRSTAEKLLAEVEIDPNSDSDSLNDDQLALLREKIATMKIEGDLRREVTTNIKRLMDIGCYRGLRHRGDSQCVANGQRQMHGHVKARLGARFPGKVNS